MKFHFIEIDLLLYFPSSGNKGRKYPKYGVAFLNRKTREKQEGKRINLEDVLDRAEIKENYPHTVAHYVESIRKGGLFAPLYEEKRVVKNVQEFFKFLSDLEV